MDVRSIRSSLTSAEEFSGALTINDSTNYLMDLSVQGSIAGKARTSYSQAIALNG